MSLQDFLAAVVRLSLLTTETAQQIAAQLSGHDPKTAAASAAKTLIAHNRLTPFQARRLLRGHGHELRQGDYLILDRGPTAPWGRWFWAQKPAAAGPAQRLLVYRCHDAPQTAQSVQLDWLKLHASVRASGLQPLQIVELAAANPARATPWQGLVVSDLPPGQTLAQWAAAARGQVAAAADVAAGGEEPNVPPPANIPPPPPWPLGFPAATELGAAIGKALDAMHQADLIHAAVSPQRVWIAADGATYLLRSGGGPPVADLASDRPDDWFDGDPPQRLDAAANQTVRGTASTASDIRALAGLVYWAATGQPLTPQHVAAQPLGTPQAAASHLLASVVLAPADRPAQTDVTSFLAALQATVPADREPAAGPPAATPVTPPRLAPAVTPPATAPAPPPTAAPPPPAAPPPVTPPPPETPPALPAESAARPPAKAAARPPTKPADKPSVKPTDSGQSMRATADSSSSPVEPPRRTAWRTGASDQPPPSRQTASRRPAGQLAAEKLAAEKLPLVDPTPVVASSADSAPSIQIRPTDAPLRSARPRRRRQNHRPVVIGSIAVAVLLVGGALVYRFIANGPAAAPVAELPRLPATASPPTGSPPVVAAESSYDWVADDRALWGAPWPANPTPPSLEMLAPGAQCIISLRLETLINSGAADWQAWLGSDLADGLQTLTDRTGVSPQQIERLVIGLVPGQDGQPTASMVVWLVEPLELSQLQRQWDAQPAQLPAGDAARDGTLFTGDAADSWAYFVRGDHHDDAALISGFAAGPLEQIRLVAEDGGAAALLPRPLQTTWDQASAEAQVVVLVVPNFLFADGRQLLQQYAPRAIDSLQQLLVPAAATALLTLDARQSWYGEVRLLAGGGTTAQQLAGSLQQAINGLPQAAESFLLEHEVDASWRAIALRLPRYLAALDQQTRIGVSHSMATANFYLPAAAAPQVTLASLLALSATSTGGTTGSAGPAAASSLGSGNAAAIDIDQLLNLPLTVQFAQESLESALELIQEELNLAVAAGAAAPQLQLMGGDLEKAGITQNQQVRDFNHRDTPLRAMLTALVQDANPDKTASSPRDPKQVLIWAVIPAAADGGDSGAAPLIRITTRPAAEGQGYEVPKEFAVEP